MVNKIIGYSGIVCDSKTTVDSYFLSKTQRMLSEIKDNNDWTLERKKKGGLSHEQEITRGLPIFAAAGALWGLIPYFFQAGYSSTMGWVFSGQYLMMHVNHDAQIQNSVTHKLNKMASWFKQDTDSASRQNLAQGLQVLVKTARKNTSSRNAPEIMLSLTLLIGGFTWNQDRLIAVPVLALGGAISSYYAWKHQATSQSQLEKVRQTVDACLKNLEKEPALSTQKR